jgi:hypothetical protein
MEHGQNEMLLQCKDNAELDAMMKLLNVKWAKACHFCQDEIGDMGWIIDADEIPFFLADYKQAKKQTIKGRK